MLYGKKYGGADPQLIEGDNFRMVISVPEFGENPARTTRIISTQQVTQQVKKLLAVSIGNACFDSDSRTVTEALTASYKPWRKLKEAEWK